MSRGKITLVVVGPHGSGKTTLGRMAAGMLGWVYQPEIGRLLREEALRRDPGNNALRMQPQFDRKVMEMEVLRDLQPVGSRIVETWHPGNMGYASLRSSKVACGYADFLKQHIRRLNHIILIQPLVIGREIATKRLTQPGAEPSRMVDFFLRVASMTSAVAGAWGLTLLPAIRTDRLGIRESCDSIVNNLFRYAENRSDLPPCCFTPELDAEQV